MSARALPSNFKSNPTFLSNYSKSPIRILPQQTGTIKNNQLLKVVLPVGCVLDLSSFAIHFDFVAKRNGADVTGNNGVGMPKYGLSGLIDTFEVFCNGRAAQTIPSYHRVYSILKDFKNNYTSDLKNMNSNPDPSRIDSLANDGTMTKRNTKAPPTAPFNFSGRYVCNNFIGFLNCQPNIVDTGLLGSIELSFLLGGPECLWSSGTAGTSVSYEISNVVCYCDCIYFKDENYNSTMKIAMDQSDGFKIVYDNFMAYSGTALTNSKTTSVKITESCQSLDYILYTFFDNTSTGLQPLQLGATSADDADADFRTVLATGGLKTLNNSVYFRRNGVATNLKVEFLINSQAVTTPMDIQQQWEETLKCFEINWQSDSKQINQGIVSLPVFQKDYYVCGLSTSHINNKDSDLFPLISGRDTMATSLNIVVNSTETGNDASHGNCTPYIITKFTSMLLLTGNRSVLPVR